ncbi:MAG: hypothetical protein WC358_01415, partial [Ignavibacteria bacterium]
MSAIYEYYIISIIIFFIPFLIFAFIKFADYFQFIFIGSLFVGIYFYWQFRVQVSLLVALSIIFFFLTSLEQFKFNKLLLPKPVKISAIAIILAVYLSSIASPFISFFSIYYATLFFIFIFLSYVIFRSVSTIEEIDNLLYFFVQVTFLSGLIILVQIFLT